METRTKGSKDKAWVSSRGKYRDVPYDYRKKHRRPKPGDDWPMILGMLAGGVVVIWLILYLCQH